jgi:hypothetical protein
VAVAANSSSDETVECRKPFKSAGGRVKAARPASCREAGRTSRHEGNSRRRFSIGTLDDLPSLVDDRVTDNDLLRAAAATLLAGMTAGGQRCGQYLKYWKVLYFPVMTNPVFQQSQAGSWQQSSSTARPLL